MISSCSAWTVAAMSRMRPVWARSSAAMSTVGVAKPSADGRALGPVQEEELVFEVDHAPAFGEQVPPPAQVHRVGTGGAVEGLRDGRPPVHYERFVVGVRYGQPPDVEALQGTVAVVAVDAPEDQGLPSDLEALQAAKGVADPDVALGDRTGTCRPSR